MALRLHHSNLWLFLLKFGFRAACNRISLGHELEMHILEVNLRPTKLDSQRLPADSQEDRGLMGLLPHIMIWKVAFYGPSPDPCPPSLLWSSA